MPSFPVATLNRMRSASGREEAAIRRGCQLEIDDVENTGNVILLLLQLGLIQVSQVGGVPLGLFDLAEKAVTGSESLLISSRLSGRCSAFAERLPVAAVTEIPEAALPLAGLPIDPRLLSARLVGLFRAVDHLLPLWLTMPRLD